MNKMTLASKKEQSLLKIRPWVLFTPYTILPLLLLVMTGNAFFGWGLQNILPQNPQHILIFTILFEYPHIVASNLIFLDGEYLRHYRKILFVRLSLVAAIVAAIFVVFGTAGFFVFFLVWTVYHVVKQQLGIGKMFNRQPSRAYEIWSWLYLGVSVLLALGIGYFSIDIPGLTRPILYWIVLIGTVLVIALGGVIGYLIKSRLGRLYIAANVILIFTSLIAFTQSFYLFAILAPRIVHDITAYVMYVTHDTNRNTPEPKQLIYRLTSRYLPVWVVTIGLSVLIGASLAHAYSSITYAILIALSLIHYTTEAFTWKGTGLHRTYLKFSS